MWSILMIKFDGYLYGISTIVNIKTSQYSIGRLVLSVSIGNIWLNLRTGFELCTYAKLYASSLLMSAFCKSRQHARAHFHKFESSKYESSMARWSDYTDYDDKFASEHCLH